VKRRAKHRSALFPLSERVVAVGDKQSAAEKEMAESVAMLDAEIRDSHRVASLLQEQALARHFTRIGFKPQKVAK